MAKTLEIPIEKYRRAQVIAKGMAEKIVTKCEDHGLFAVDEIFNCSDLENLIEEWIVYKVAEGK